MSRARFSAVVVILSLFVLAVVGAHSGEPPDEESTCEVLREIAADQTDVECSTNGEKDCDTIECETTFSGTPVQYSVTVLPCKDPPAIGLRLVVAGKEELNKEFNEPGEAQVLGGLGMLEVTVRQLDKALGVELMITSPVPITGVGYTEIPVECSGAGSAGVKVEVLLTAILSVMMALLLLL